MLIVTLAHCSRHSQKTAINIDLVREAHQETVQYMRILVSFGAPINYDGKKYRDITDNYKE